MAFPTSGAPAAQPHFIRGVLLLHSFEYDEAIAAFREAQRIDRGFAMAYWGEAMCYNQPLWHHENLERARDALTRLTLVRAATNSVPLTDRERGFIEAAQKLFGPGDKIRRDQAYADRLGRLAQAFPQDDEAAAFHALALLATIPEMQPNPAVSARAGAIALAILKRNPEHPGAAHYALHAYGDGEHARSGLQAARTYAGIAPASSHARHMPSHVFLPLGLWDEAAASDESAFETSVAAARRKGLSAAQHDVHSLSWLQYEYLQQGRFAKAREGIEIVRRALAAADSIPSAAAGGTARGSGPAEAGRHERHGFESEIGRGYGPLSLKNELASMRARLVVESGQWADMKGQGTFDNVDELFALGMVGAKLGDLGRAQAALEHMGKAKAAAPDPDNRELAEIMRLELDGQIRLARKQTAGALQALEEAAGREAKRPRPSARPFPIKPAGELWAEGLLSAGRPRDAVAQFRAALTRTPRRAASLLGLARAANAAGLRTEAANAAREFLAVWHAADTDRPEIKEARTILAGSR